MPRVFFVIALTVTCGACASLEGFRQLVQAPRFAEVPDQPATIRIQPPSRTRPLGGAAIRLYTEVSNPNPFGLRLGTLDGTLFLDGSRAATADFPLGLPLNAGERSVVPLDLSVSFSDLPGLADVVRRAARREPVEFRLDGTIGVDAGRLGQPVFGPMTLLRGDFRATPDRPAPFATRFAPRKPAVFSTATSGTAHAGGWRAVRVRALL